MLSSRLRESLVPVTQVSGPMRDLQTGEALPPAVITSKGDPVSLSGECWRPLALRTWSSRSLDGCFHVSYWIPWDLQRTTASSWQIWSRLVFVLRSPRESKDDPSHLCTDKKSAQLRRVPAEETGLPTGLQMSIAVSRCR